MARVHVSSALAVTFALLLSASPLAQQSDVARARDEQLGRIFQANEYQLPRFAPARWLPDGSGYTVVEQASGRAGASDIVRYDATTGARSVLIAGSALVPPGKK